MIKRQLSCIVLALAVTLLLSATPVYASHSIDTEDTIPTSLDVGDPLTIQFRSSPESIQTAAFWYHAIPNTCFSGDLIPAFKLDQNGLFTFTPTPAFAGLSCPIPIMYDADVGDTARFPEFTIEIPPIEPTLPATPTITPYSQNVREGDTIPSLSDNVSPHVIVDPTTVLYAISNLDRNLPDGVTFDESTGDFVGTVSHLTRVNSGNFRINFDWSYTVDSVPYEETGASIFIVNVDRRATLVGLPPSSELVFNEGQMVSFTIRVEDPDTNEEFTGFSTQLSLPDGLMFDNGTISGIPTSLDSGSHRFIVNHRDVSAVTVREDFIIVINDVPVTGSGDVREGQTGVNLDLGVIGDGITCTASSTLPGSLVIDSTCRITGDVGNGVITNGLDEQAFPITYTLTDGSSTETGTYRLTVNTITDRAPGIIITSDMVIGLVNNTVATITDPDGDPLTVSVTNGTFGNARAVPITPDVVNIVYATDDPVDVTDTDSITVTYSDGQTEDTMTIPISYIATPGVAPEISSTASIDPAPFEGDLVEFMINGTDADGDDTRWELSSDDFGETFNTETGEFSWTPDDTHGDRTITFTFTLVDSFELRSQPRILSFTVMEFNAVPTPSGTYAVSVSEGGNLDLHPLTGFVDDIPENPTSTIAYTIESGDLPPDIILNRDGTFSGTVSHDIANLANSREPFPFTWNYNDGDNDLLRSGTITVNNVNRAPTITGTIPATIDDTPDEQELVMFALVGSDDDTGDDLPIWTVSADNTAADDNATITQGGDFRWTPDETHGSSTITFTFNLTDAEPLLDTREFTFNVQEVDPAPVSSPYTANVDEGDTIPALTGSITDPDEIPEPTEEYGFVSGDLPPGIMIEPDGSFSGTLSHDVVTAQNTPDEFIFRWSYNDGTNTLVMEDGIITVNDVVPNRPPTIDLTETPATVTVTRGVSTIIATVTDPDGDQIFITTINMPTQGGRITPDTSEPGTATITFFIESTTPTSELTFGYSDGIAEAKTQSIRVMVENRRDDSRFIETSSPFEESDRTKNVGEEFSFQFTLMGGTAQNNQWLIPISNCDITDDNIGDMGLFTWTPTLVDEEKTCEVELTVQDTEQITTDLTFELIVPQFNQHPIIRDYNRVVTELGSIPGLRSVVTNPVEDPPDRNLYTFISGDLPPGITIDPDGSFSGTLSQDAANIANSPAEYTFRWTFEDDSTAEVMEQVGRLNVTNLNRPPVIGALPMIDMPVDEGEEVSFMLTGTDDDVATGDPEPIWSVSANDTIADADATITDRGAFLWTPGETHGSNTIGFTFTLTDTVDSPDPVIIPFSVREVNTAPMISATPYVFNVTEGGSISRPLSDLIEDATEIPALDIEYTITGDLPPGITLENDGSFSGTVSSDATTPDESPKPFPFTWRYSDSIATADQPGTINVSEPNLPPVPRTLPNSVQRNGICHDLVRITDADGDRIEVDVTTLPEHGTYDVDISTDGLAIISYCTTSSETTDELTLIYRDPLGDFSDPKIIGIFIIPPINDPPTFTSYDVMVSEAQRIPSLSDVVDNPDEVPPDQINRYRIIPGTGDLPPAIRGFLNTATGDFDGVFYSDAVSDGGPSITYTFMWTFQDGSGTSPEQPGTITVSDALTSINERPVIGDYDPTILEGDTIPSLSTVVDNPPESPEDRVSYRITNIGSLPRDIAGSLDRQTGDFSETFQFDKTTGSKSAFFSWTFQDGTGTSKTQLGTITVNNNPDLIPTPTRGNEGYVIEEYRQTVLDNTMIPPLSRVVIDYPTNSPDTPVYAITDPGNLPASVARSLNRDTGAFSATFACDSARIGIPIVYTFDWTFTDSTGESGAQQATITSQINSGGACITSGNDDAMITRYRGSISEGDPIPSLSTAVFNPPENPIDRVSVYTITDRRTLPEYIADSLDPQTGDFAAPFDCAFLPDNMSYGFEWTFEDGNGEYPVQDNAVLTVSPNEDCVPLTDTDEIPTLNRYQVEVLEGQPIPRLSTAVVNNPFEVSADAHEYTITSGELRKVQYIRDSLNSTTGGFDEVFSCDTVSAGESEMYDFVWSFEDGVNLRENAPEGTITVIDDPNCMTEITPTNEVPIVSIYDENVDEGQPIPSLSTAVFDPPESSDGAIRYDITGGVLFTNSAYEYIVDSLDHTTGDFGAVFTCDTLVTASSPISVTWTYTDGSSSGGNTQTAPSSGITVINDPNCLTPENDEPVVVRYGAGALEGHRIPPLSNFVTNPLENPPDVSTYTITSRTDPQFVDSPLPDFIAESLNIRTGAFDEVFPCDYISTSGTATFGFGWSYSDSFHPASTLEATLTLGRNDQCTGLFTSQNEEADFRPYFSTVRPGGAIPSLSTAVIDPEEEGGDPAIAYRIVNPGNMPRDIAGSLDVDTGEFSQRFDDELLAGEDRRSFVFTWTYQDENREYVPRTASLMLAENSGGSSNNWKKKPTFGQSWEISSSQLVTDGFTFNGHTLDITDNWHTDFTRTSSIIGETNSVNMKAYAADGFSYVTLSLGVPEIGEVSDAETDIILMLNRNYDNPNDYDITEIIHEQKESLVDESQTTAAVSKAECNPGSDIQCYSFDIDFKVNAPLKSDVLAISAVDSKRRSTVTYVNEGVEFTGQSLLAPNTHYIVQKKTNQGPAEMLTLTQQDRRYNIWEDDSGYLWAQNDHGSWFSITSPESERFVDGAVNVMTRMHSNFEKLTQQEQEKATVIFDASKLVSVPDQTFSYDYSGVSYGVSKMDKLADELNIEQGKAERIMELLR